MVTCSCNIWHSWRLYEADGKPACTNYQNCSFYSTWNDITRNKYGDTLWEAAAKHQNIWTTKIKRDRRQLKMSFNSFVKIETLVKWIRQGSSEWSWLWPFQTGGIGSVSPQRLAPRTSIAPVLRYWEYDQPRIFMSWHCFMESDYEIKYKTKPCYNATPISPLSRIQYTWALIRVAWFGANILIVGVKVYCGNYLPTYHTDINWAQMKSLRVAVPWAIVCLAFLFSFVCFWYNWNI